MTKSLGVVITCAICSKTVLKTLVGTLITIISEKSIAFLTSVVAFTVSGNLPTGNLFEYSAYVIQNYEKKWKEKKSKEDK